eukprot:9547059-Alexandrium_andersonii.AAC.1
MCIRDRRSAPATSSRTPWPSSGLLLWGFEQRAGRELRTARAHIVRLRARALRFRRAAPHPRVPELPRPGVHRAVPRAALVLLPSR